MKVSHWVWDVIEDRTREVLLVVTKPINNPDVAGYVFGVVLILTDHLLQPLKWLLK